MRTALLVTHRRALADLVLQKFMARGWSIRCAESQDVARREILSNPAFGTVLLDMGLDGVIELADLITARDPLTVMVIVTESETLDTAVSAIRRGVSDFITLPIRHEEFVELLNRVEARTAMRRGGGELGRIEQMFTSIVSRLDAVESTLRTVGRYVGAT